MLTSARYTVLQGLSNLEKEAWVADEYVRQRDADGVAQGVCARCWLRARHCMCDELTRLLADCAAGDGGGACTVAVYQHYKEYRRPSSTGKLFGFCCEGSTRTVYGDSDGEARLAELVGAQGTYVLYPAKDAAASCVTAEELHAAVAAGTQPKLMQLVVLDGTWPEAAALCRRLTSFAAPRFIRLDEKPAAAAAGLGPEDGSSCAEWGSLRRQTKPGGRSTLEAVAEVLETVAQGGGGGPAAADARAAGRLRAALRLHIPRVLENDQRLGVVVAPKQQRKDKKGGSGGAGGAAPAGGPPLVDSAVALARARWRASQWPRRPGTEECRHFAERGWCRLGKRCEYNHSERTLDKFYGLETGGKGQQPAANPLLAVEPGPIAGPVAGPVEMTVADGVGLAFIKRVSAAVRSMLPQLLVELHTADPQLVPVFDAMLSGADEQVHRIGHCSPPGQPEGGQGGLLAAAEHVLKRGGEMMISFAPGRPGLDPNAVPEEFRLALAYTKFEERANQMHNVLRRVFQTEGPGLRTTPRVNSGRQADTGSTEKAMPLGVLSLGGGPGNDAVGVVAFLMERQARYGSTFAPPVMGVPPEQLVIAKPAKMTKAERKAARKAGLPAAAPAGKQAAPAHSSFTLSQEFVSTLPLAPLHPSAWLPACPPAGVCCHVLDNDQAWYTGAGKFVQRTVRGSEAQRAGCSKQPRHAFEVRMDWHDLSRCGTSTRPASSPGAVAAAAVPWRRPEWRWWSSLTCSACSPVRAGMSCRSAGRSGVVCSRPTQKPGLSLSRAPSPRSSGRR